MYTSSPASTSVPASTETDRFSNVIPYNDLSPFSYLLEAPSFAPMATATPIDQYPDQIAELNAPPSQFDAFCQSLAPPASFDHPFINASTAQSNFPSTLNQTDIQFQPVLEESNQSTPIPPFSFYQSSQPPFSAISSISIVPEIGSYSIPSTPSLPLLSCAPFINNSTPFVSTLPTQQHHSRIEQEKVSTLSMKDSLSSSSSSASPSPALSPAAAPAPASASASTTKPTNTTSQASSSSSSKTYPCDLCDKVFHRAYNLKSHQLSHSKARPYECRFDGCPWRFSRPHDLRRHEQLHAGHRPFGCSTCGKRFAHLDALQRHAQGDTICLRIANMLAHAASVTEPTTKTDK